jgi:hypothetical protein
MTPDQIVDLLTIATAYDRRTVGEGDVHAWLDSARRGRWTFDEAAEAVKAYYATTIADRPFVMPSHITHLIKAERQDRAMRATNRELVQAGPPHPRTAAMAAELAAKFEIPEPRSALRVPCPFCGATPGNPCTRPAPGGEKRTTTHPSRVEASAGKVTR